MLYLDVSSIPAGTPWIWFTSPKNSKHYKNTTYHHKYIPESHADEYEVLLPPGTLKITDINEHAGFIEEVDVTYRPASTALTMLNHQFIHHNTPYKPSASEEPTSELWKLFNNTGQDHAQSDHASKKRKR